ncbi:MAG: CHASE domain-containing protein, partial [Deltaproteobacteria bacterium]|nr:CHASE domain-containing protein [Deltaproteobacteria bacterium]
MKRIPASINSRFAPWLVLTCGLIFSFLLWHAEERLATLQAEARFQRITGRMEFAIKNRLQKYALMLEGYVALFNASLTVERQEWKAYFLSINPCTYYSGIQAIGFCQQVPAAEKKIHMRELRAEGFPDYTIRPEGERPEYFPIIYLEPFSGKNLRAFGYDASFEPVRAAALKQACNRGETIISRKLKLVEDPEDETQNGFVMFLPVYKKNQPLATLQDRRAALQGLVFGSFMMNDFMQGIFDIEQEIISFTVYDGPDTDAEVYHSAARLKKHPGDFKPLFQKQATLMLYGREWTLHFQSLPAFETYLDRTRLYIFLGISLFTTVLLFAITFFIVSRGKKLTAEILRREQYEEDLRRSKERYQLLFDGMTQGAFIQAADGRLIEINPAGLRIFGVSRDEFLSRDSYCPEWRVIREDGSPVQPEEHPSMVALLTGQPVLDSVYGLFNPHINGYVWLIANATPRFLPSESKPFQVFVTLHDITERRHAQEALKKSEYLQKAILDNIPDIAWLKDPAGKYIAVNDAYEKAAGRLREEILGKADEDVWPAEQAAQYRADDLLTMRARTRQIVEESMRDHDGALRVMESIKTPLYNDTGEFIGTAGIARDITERIQQAEALRLASRKWRETFDAITDSVALLSIDAEIEQCNQAFIDFLDLDLPDIVGRKYYQLVHGMKDHIADCPTVRALKTGIQETMCLQINEKFFLVVADPIKGPDGKITGFVHIMRDITDRTLAEEALQAKNAELERFTYSISHDLKSPLVTIRTFLGHLAEDIKKNDAGRTAQDLCFIDTAAKKMNVMLDELLQMSRIGRMKNPSVETPLQELVQEALSMVAGRI